MKLNLKNGRSIEANHPLYLSPAPEGRECQCLAPEYPFYRCTRWKGHEHELGNGAKDHAAHGGRKSSLVMYARWSDDEVNGKAEERRQEQEIENDSYTDDDGRPLGIA